jgi:hypothetical protein
MTLPPIAPEVTAEAVAALPARLRGRLDAAVDQARTWPVEQAGDVVTVRPDAQVVVTLAVPVLEAGDAACSCLLAPRCLHRAAVLSAAPILTERPGPTPEVNPAPTQTTKTAVNDVQVNAAGLLWSTAAGLLGAGIPGGGAVAQAELLRAGHEARAVGLHAASAAAIRVVEQVRALRREDPGARLGRLTDDLRELLTTCHRLAGRDAAAVGVARREYAPVGDLRLYGLFCEPVRAATGHAGAVTYLADERGRIWTVSDVKPADPGAAKGSTRASVQLGEVRLSHHDLARAGLRAINAYASEAGRLSHGRARQAVAMEGASWFDPPLAALWQTGPGDQVERWLAGGTDLAFLDGTIAGITRQGLRLDLAGRSITVGAPIEDPAFPYVTNLRLLADHARGRGVRLIARFTGPRRVAGLAVAAPWLRDHHADLGGQTLTRAELAATELPRAEPPTLSPIGAELPGTELPGTEPVGTEPAGTEAVGTEPAGIRDQPMPSAPPLHLLRHLLERVAATGRPALLSGTADDARTLGEAQLGIAAALVAALGAAGTRRTRDVFGRLDPHDPHRLALAWLAAAVYEQGATHEVTRSAWR